MELMQASRQWSSRPADQRFTSLTDLDAFTREQHDHSRALNVSSRALKVEPAMGDEMRGVQITGANGVPYHPTNWSFGQLAGLVGAPAGYLHKLPAPIVADCLNVGLRQRSAEDVGVLLRKNGNSELAAATGPRYGRIWNKDVTGALTDRFGDGISGNWRVPGEFGKAITVSKDNTTLYASDRDMFVFLADEVNRVEIADRRDGQPGSLARGFFVWNSEVGSATLGLAFFLFDYACCNRIVWGATQYQEARIRHTASAPDRWMEEITPVLTEYANGSAQPVVKAIEDARAKRLDDVDAFLANRFGARMADKIAAAHIADENRPIETVWDAVTGATAFARTITHQDARVAMEREAGKLLDF